MEPSTSILGRCLRSFKTVIARGTWSENARHTLSGCALGRRKDETR
jgi:hypothetical protein